MIKKLVAIICIVFSVSLLAQSSSDKQIVTDSIVFSNFKMYLVDNDGIAALKIFPTNYRIPRKGVLKLAPPCKFAKDFDGHVIKQPFPLHEILASLIVIGNPIRKCKDQGYSCYVNDPFRLRKKDIPYLENDFCGSAYQGIIINYEGVILSDKYHYNTRNVICSRGNFDVKDFYSIADEIVEMDPCR